MKRLLSIISVGLALAVQLPAQVTPSRPGGSTVNTGLFVAANGGTISNTVGGWVTTRHNVLSSATNRLAAYTPSANAKMLRLDLMARSTLADEVDYPLFWLNNDTGSNYWLGIAITAYPSSAPTQAAFGEIPRIPAANANSNQWFGASTTTFFNPAVASPAYKKVVSSGAAFWSDTDFLRTEIAHSEYRTTNALTSVQVYCAGGSFAVGTTEIWSELR